MKGKAFLISHNRYAFLSWWSRIGSGNFTIHSVYSIKKCGVGAPTQFHTHEIVPAGRVCDNHVEEEFSVKYDRNIITE